jgi:hypothetical protein
LQQEDWMPLENYLLNNKIDNIYYTLFCVFLLNLQYLLYK